MTQPEGRGATLHAAVHSIRRRCSRFRESGSEWTEATAALADSTRCCLSDRGSSGEKAPKSGFRQHLVLVSQDNGHAGRARQARRGGWTRALIGSREARQ